MKLVIYFIFISSFFCQNTKEITVLSSFSDINKINETDFYLAWELPVNTENHQSYYQFKSINDDDYLLFDKLLSNPKHAVLFISFDKSKTDIDMVATFRNGKQGIFKRKPLYWLGLQEIETSYQYVLSLMNKIDKEEKLYSLLNVHQKNEITLKFYRDKFNTANSNRARKNLIFWIGAIKTENAAKALDKILSSDISNSLKEKVMFAFSRNRTTYAMKRLISISKSDSENHSVRKKAKFWLASAAGKYMEKEFNKEVYNRDDLEVRKSAVFALYNMKDYKGLRDIATRSKDIRLRKKAIFWLGQIDRTPIDFFETILNL